MYTSIFGNSSLDYLFIFCIVILFFLVIRGINLWYWKIDKIEALLEDIEANTRTSDKTKEEFEKESKNLS